MKKNNLLCLLLAISVSSFCQQTKTVPVLNKHDYLQKSKTQKALAWVLLAGGTTAGIIGIIKFNSFHTLDWNEGEDNTVSTTFMFITGAVAAISSIPFFIAAKKNKKKAAGVSFKMEGIRASQQQSLVYHSYPALSFKLAIQ